MDKIEQVRELAEKWYDKYTNTRTSEEEIDEFINDCGLNMDLANAVIGLMDFWKYTEEE